MILTVAQCYVSEKQKYANGFVHARVKVYKKNNIDAKVFVLQRKPAEDYIIDNIEVKVGNEKKLVEYIEKNDNITGICFHFFNPSMARVVQKIKKNIPVFIFVHGNEALYWYQRIFPDRFNGVVRTLKFIKYVIVNTYSISKIQKFFKKNKKNVQIICVSNWMKDITIKNWKLEIDNNIHIIPNVINENLFKYIEKTPDMRYNILMIRNFNSGKYALDIAMNTIIELSKYPEFKKIHFTIFGDGWLFEKYTSMVKKFKNVEVNRKLLSQEQIAIEHKRNGIFLCPTRQDAQGVSMCEAMSSGLVPIASNNTAIPEFLPEEYQLALNEPKELAKRIITLIRNKDEFLELSKKVSNFIQHKCATNQTTDKEIEIITNKGINI